MMISSDHKPPNHRHLLGKVCQRCLRPLLAKKKSDTEWTKNSYCSEICMNLNSNSKEFHSEYVDAVVALAWDDRASFASIYMQYGLTEPQVINVMRKKLKTSSFKLWRKRVYGRVLKHKTP